MNCNTVIGGKYEAYKTLVTSYGGAAGEAAGGATIGTPAPQYVVPGMKLNSTPQAKAMAELGIKKPCCRTHFLTHIDMI